MPFLLTPAHKDYLWGGDKLIADYGKETDLPVLAESWELSAHPDGDCVIATGPGQGTPFSQHVREHRAELGEKAAGMEEFPLLIKLIDAQKSLSVQVHPDDAYAARVEGGQGKTEMWCVLDCEPGAFLYLGFERAATGAEVRRRIEEGTVEEILHREPVRPGEVYFIEAGTIHAIGAGIVLAEIQQNSNATYRVYDYGRLDQDGKPRELHVEKALEVLDYSPSPGKVSLPPPREEDGASLQPLASCPYFTVERAAVSGRWSAAQKRDSFTSLLCVEGAGALHFQGERLPLRKGDSVFVPAGDIPYTVEGNLTLVVTCL